MAPCSAGEATTDRYRSRQGSEQARSAHRHVYVSRSVGGAGRKEGTEKAFSRKARGRGRGRERVQFVVRLETDGLKLVAASITKSRSGNKPTPAPVDVVVELALGD